MGKYEIPGGTDGTYSNDYKNFGEVNDFALNGSESSKEPHVPFSTDYGTGNTYLQYVKKQEILREMKIIITILWKNLVVHFSMMGIGLTLTESSALMMVSII